MTEAVAAQPMPIIMDEGTFSALPRIGASAAGGQLLDRGSLFQINASGSPRRSDHLMPGQMIRIFRQGLRLVPPGGGDSLGVLAVAVGEARVLTSAEVLSTVLDGTIGDAIWLRVTATYQEVMPGDSLLPTVDIAQWQPATCPVRPNRDGVVTDNTTTADPAAHRRPPEIIALTGHFNLMATNHDQVVMSGGCNQGYQPGTRVAIWRAPEKRHGRSAGNPVNSPINNALSVFADNPPIDQVTTPSVRIGTGRVLSAYPDVAILQIMDAQRPVQNGDPVRPLPR